MDYENVTHEHDQCSQRYAAEQANTAPRWGGELSLFAEKLKGTGLRPKVPLRATMASIRRGVDFEGLL